MSSMQSETTHHPRRHECTTHQLRLLTLVFSEIATVAAQRSLNMSTEIFLKGLRYNMSTFIICGVPIIRIITVRFYCRR